MSAFKAARRQERREQAAERLARNTVIDCECGNRHATNWKGCKVNA